MVDSASVVICGGKNTLLGGLDYTIVKYNETIGTQIWAANYDAYGGDDYATSLVRDTAHWFAVTGIAAHGAMYEYHTLLLDNGGNQQWVNINSIQSSTVNALPQIGMDNVAFHFYVAGEKGINHGDMAVYQVTPGGNKTWEITHNGASNGLDAAVDLVLDNLGIIYLTGYTKNSSGAFDFTTMQISQIPYLSPLISIANHLTNPIIFTRTRVRYIELIACLPMRLGITR